MNVEFVQAVVKVALLGAEVIAQIGEAEKEFEEATQLKLILGIQVVDLYLVDALEEAQDVGIDLCGVSR